MEAPQFFKLLCLVLAGCLLSSMTLCAQPVPLTNEQTVAVQVHTSVAKLMGKDALRVTKDSSVKAVDEPTFARINGKDVSGGIGLWVDVGTEGFFADLTITKLE